MKPIIGIIGKNQGKFEKDLWHRIDVVDEFCDGFILQGRICRQVI